jgi:hypothetical protein
VPFKVNSIFAVEVPFNLIVPSAFIVISTPLIVCDTASIPNKFLFEDMMLHSSIVSLDKSNCAIS